ncbi:MAG: hypothetical protein ACEQSR_12280 [Candidatus Methylacidiphilales bacterium]
MNNFFKRQSTSTYILFAVLTIVLTEIAFLLAWDGNDEKKYIFLFAFIAFVISAINNYYYFKNLINNNPKLKRRILVGITAMILIISFIFSFSMLQF